MDPWFGTFIVLTLLAAVAFVVHRKMPRIISKTTVHDVTNEYGRKVDIKQVTTEKPNVDRILVGWVSAAFAVLALVMFFQSLYVIIPTRHVGVEVFGGKPGSTFSNGFHWKNPVATVERFDGTVQTERYSTDKDDQGDPITVLLSNGSGATLNVTYQWRLADNLTTLYKDYPNASTDTLNQNVVKRDVQQQLNIAYAAYNPYAGVIAQQQALLDAQRTGKPLPTGAASIDPATTYQAYAAQASTSLVTVLAQQDIVFVSLTISSITFDAGTIERLAEYNQSIVDTQIAIQKEATAQAQAAANALIAKDPPTLAQIEQQCINDTFNSTRPLPAAWNCFGGGGAAPVIPLQ